MTFKPYPFQQDDLQKLAENDYVALVNIQTGGGKSLLSAWAAQRSGAQQVLIIAPKNTHGNAWAETVRAVTGTDVRPMGNSTKEQRHALADFEFGAEGWYIVTPNLMGHAKTDISMWTPDFLISDEIHTYNKPGGKIAKRWIQMGAQSPMKLALSGTPARRDFSRMWTNGRHLWPELYRRGQVAYDNRFGWNNDRMESVDVYTNQRNPDGTPKKVKQWTSEAQPGRWISEAPCVIQHFRRDKCCDHHANGFLSHDAPLVIERVVPLLPAQKRIIKELETSFMAWLDDNPMVVDLSLTQKLRIRQVCLGVPTLDEWEEPDAEGGTVLKQSLTFEEDCASPVADEVLNILEHLEDGEPVIVYLEMQRFATVLVKKLQKAGYSAAEYSGATVKERDNYLARFGRDIQVLVGTTAAISNGTDGIQSRTSVEIIAQTHVDDTLMEQQDARTDRIGARRQVMRFRLIDDLGYATGQLSDQLRKRLVINWSTRKV